MKWLLLIVSYQAIALDGIITVLEAPLFHSPNHQGKVIQWMRKGDKIPIHGSTQGMTTDPEIEAQLDAPNIYRNYQLNIEDEHFGDQPYVYQNSDGFYKTVDQRGHSAFIKSEHVYLLTEKPDEISQTILTPDETDYRLREPLHDQYPFDVRDPKRISMLALGSGTNARSSSVYRSPIVQEKTLYNFNLDGFFGRIRSQQHLRRSYYGYAFQLNNLDSRVETQDFLARENWLRIGLGPHYTYSPWFREHYEVHLTFSLLLQYSSVKISIEEDLGADDIYSNRFQGFHLIPKVGSFIQFNKLFGDLDFLIGAYAQLEIQRVYAPQSEKLSAGLLYSDSNQGFRQATNIELNAFIGLQQRL